MKSERKKRGHLPASQRKPYVQSKLRRLLSLEQQAEIKKWLFEERASYGVVRKRVRDRFGVLTSLTALCDYYHRERRARNQVNEPEPAGGGGELLLGITLPAATTLQVIRHGSAVSVRTSEAPTGK